jgi:molybdopterin/thiamine biosynthesis adenylyltransferase
MSGFDAFEHMIATGDRDLLRFTLRPGERQALDALAWRHGIELQDGIDSQLEEWVRTVQPGEERMGASHRATIAAFVGDRETFGVWVYYPWRALVTRLLPRDAFRAVRTNRNHDKITASQQATLLRKRIGVIGLSVGHASALVLAQEGLCEELRLADFDVIELSNLNRLRTSLAHLGMSKLEVTRREVAEIDPWIRVVPFTDGIREHNVETFLVGGSGPLDLVVEECDTLPMKLSVRERCRAHGIPVVMDTNDRGLLDVERFDREPSRPVLHGLMGTVDGETAATLPPEQRMDLFMAFFGGAENLSPGLRDSLARIGTGLVSYPQLSSDVHLGAALVANAARRVLLDDLRRSGRYRIDLDDLVADGESIL